MAEQVNSSGEENKTMPGQMELMAGDLEELARTEQDCEEQDREEQDREEQDREEQDREEQDPLKRAREECWYSGSGEGYKEGRDMRWRHGQVALVMEVARRRFGEAPKKLEAKLQAASQGCTAEWDMADWLDRMCTSSSIEEAMKESWRGSREPPA